MLLEKPISLQTCKPHSICTSLIMRDLCEKAFHLAQTDKHIIIIGESGSGKRYFAKKIHQMSNRSEGPFHTFYCIDVDEDDYKKAFWEHLQFEDEHIILKYDAIEKASFGSLHLDQFSELPTQFMMNIIDSFTKGCHQIYRYGENASPRLIISVKQNIYQKLNQKKSWKLIMEKLDPLSIIIPPLRDRKEDIPSLVNIFLNEFRNELKQFSHLQIAPEVVNNFMQYDWPGNVRQLRNILKQGAILASEGMITNSHLPTSIEWKSV